MYIKELKDRIDTVYYVICLAFMTNERYVDILSDKNKFTTVFPEIEFSNPKIKLFIDKHEVIFTTTKKEITNENNRNLFKAWQIALGIVGMTSIIEFYLKSIYKKICGKEYTRVGLFYEFSKKTNIKLEEFKDYDEIHNYYQVRHITMHNLSRIDQKFKNKIQTEITLATPYVFYPKDLKKYRELIIKMAEYIEEKANKKGLSHNLETTP